MRYKRNSERPPEYVDVQVVTPNRIYRGYWDNVQNGFYRQNKKGSLKPIKINNVVGWEWHPEKKTEDGI